MSSKQQPAELGLETYSRSAQTLPAKSSHRLDKKTQGVTGTSSPSSPPPLQQKQRWNKRIQSNVTAPNQNSPTGWRTVRRALRTQPEWSLLNEWTVPPVQQLRLNCSGALLCEQTSEALPLLLQMKGTTAPAALDLPPALTGFTPDLRSEDGISPQEDH